MENKMNSLMVFEGNNVEVFEFEGKILFNPYHVGKCLDIKDSAVRMNIKEMDSDEVIKLRNSDVNSNDIRKLNNAGENFLTEEGVYALIFKSRKPSAIRFQKWVTKEVLPSISKKGGYILDNIDAKLSMIEDILLTVDDERVLQLIGALAGALKEAQPKASQFTLLMDSQGDLDLQEFSKTVDGLILGRNKLLNVLRNNEVIMQKSTLPYQTYMDRKYFRVIQVEKNGMSFSKTLVTKKGMTWLVKKLKEWEYIKQTDVKVIK